jgi:hypothetical protein
VPEIYGIGVGLNSEQEVNTWQMRRVRGTVPKVKVAYRPQSL